MAADLYWDWLEVPRDRRPPNFFDLLGLPATADDAAAIEKAAQRQIERVKHNLDSSQAAEGAKLLQEIAAARATLIDPAKRAKYLSSLLSPSGGSIQPWWQEAVKKPADKPPAKPLPAQTKAPAAQPSAKPKSSAFQGLDAAPRRRSKRSASSAAAVFAMIGGVGLVLLVAIGIAIVIIGSDTPKTSELAKATEKSNGTTPTRTASQPALNPEPENHEAAKSIFLSEAEPAADDSNKPSAAMNFERHKGLVQAVTLAPNGKRFLSCGEGGVFEWDRPSGKSFLRHEFKVPATAAAYLPSTRLAACADEGSVVILDLPTNRVKNTLKYPSGLLLAMAACCDGQHLLTGGNDGTLRFWDVSKAEPDTSIDLGESFQINCLAISRDGKFAAAGANDGSLGIWELPALKKVWQMKRHAGAVTCVAFAPNGKQLASSSADKSVAAWETATGKAVARFEGHDPAALSVAFLEGSPGLVSGGRDGSIKFWSFESGLLRSLPVAGSVLCLAVAPADRYVLAGGSGGLLRLLPMPELDFEVVVKEQPPAKRLPLPNPEEVEMAVKSLRAKHQTELEQAKRDVLAALAERWLAKAGGKSQAPQRLALFRESRDLLAKVGKLESALSAIEQCNRWFEIDALAENAAILAPVVAATPPAGQRPIVEAAVKLLRQTETDDRPELGKQVVAVLEQAAEKSTMPELAKLVAGIKKQREQDAIVAAKMNSLRTKLQTMPNDRDANAAYGMLLCSKQNWKDGLAHLTKGSDAKLADLAKQDLGDPKDAKIRFKLAQAWADAADSPGEAKLICLLRAKHWVELAEPNLLAEDKAKATVLLGQVAAKIGALTPTAEPPRGSAEKPRKSSDPIVRRNFNTFRNEATFKSQWKVEGSSRWENVGLRLLENPVSIQSTFRLVDNWKMEIDADYDGREMLIEVNKQVITLVPTRNEPMIFLERKGKKLSYALVNPRAVPKVKTISLPDDALEPSIISVKLQGLAFGNRKDGMLIPRILVNGPVKVEE